MSIYYYLGMVIFTAGVVFFLKTVSEHGKVTFRKTLICLSLIVMGLLVSSMTIWK